jgi:DNA-binding transcriptional MerR regulator
MTDKHRHLAILHDGAENHGAASGSESMLRPESVVPEGELLQVGELAKKTGKTVRAIHLYEDMGLLRPVDRSPGRYRLYNRDSVERVRWISKLKAVGFSLPELKELNLAQSSATTGKEAASLLRSAYLERLTQVQGKLRELHRLEQELLSSLTYLDACQSACADDADRESCPECERHVDQPAAPPLVAGAHVS